MPFNQHDLLRQTGYSEGDVLGSISLRPNTADTISTSSTSFISASKFIEARIPAPEDIFPGGAMTVVVGGNVAPGTDETATMRIRNSTDGETMAGPADFTSSGPIQIGPTEYTPTTTASPIRVDVEIKSDPGTNSSAFGRHVTALLPQL